MKTYTVGGIMSFHPCYPREKVESLWAGEKSLTLPQILALPISAADKLWFAFHPGVLTKKQTAEVLDLIVTRAVANHALPHPATKAWAEAWLAGDKGASASAAASAAAVAATEAAWLAWAAAVRAAWLAADAADAAVRAAAARAAWLAADAADAAVRAAAVAERELQVKDVLTMLGASI